jgi:hypothetical protein
MSKGNTFINDFLKLILNATAIANIADNAATSPATNLYFSAHTASPGAGGDQTTSEVVYTSYARVAVARTTSGFTASSAQSSSPVATVAFPTATGGAGATITHFAIGTGSSGTGKILFFGTVTPNIPVAAGAGTTPQYTTASTITET